MPFFSSTPRFAVLVLSVIAIGVAVTGNSGAAGDRRLGLGAGRDR